MSDYEYGFVVGVLFMTLKDVYVWCRKQMTKQPDDEVVQGKK